MLFLNKHIIKMTESMFRKATDNMKNAINSLSEEKRNFLLKYEPCADRGYAWDENQNYKKIKNILSIITDSDGHSGASFSVCLRGAIEEIREMKELEPLVIQAHSDVTKEDREIITLQPIPKS